MTELYDIDVTLDDGTTYKLDKYKGRPMLIVNTATRCGLVGQFAGLEELYQQFKDDGLIVLGFPSNQFMQEVSSSEAAGKACRMHYGVTFPIHQIQDVNGRHASDVFKYLTAHSEGVFNSAIKWNFTKFLIDQDGNVVKRYAPQTKPEQLVDDIQALVSGGAVEEA